MRPAASARTLAAPSAHREARTARHGHPPSPRTWHALAATDVAGALGCNPAVGLDSADAAARLLTRGPNRLRQKPPRPAWRRFLDQFANLLILVLLGRPCWPACSAR
jgi:magnesium-transporting ATPase (P-type)